MPLGILTVEQANEELSRFGLRGGIESHISDKVSEDNSNKSDARLDNIITFSEINRGRGQKEETPESLRKFIASEALCGADPEVLSKDYNVSKSSISAYKNGATSTASYNEPDEDLLESNKATLDRIIGPAQSRILKAIKSITNEKLDSSKARDAASIAASLSSVVKNLRPETESGQKTQINIFAPRKNEEEDYEIIQVQS